MTEEQCHTHARRIERLGSVLGLVVDMEKNEVRLKRRKPFWALVVAYMPLGGPQHTILDTKDSMIADAFGDALEMVARSRRSGR